MCWGFYNILRSLTNDRRGVALIYVSALLPILIGGGLLAIDASRLYNLHTSLQAGADALAVAGGAELDRRAAIGGGLSSIDRATNAINNLVQNQSRFGASGLSNVTVQNIRFLSTLPANDTDPITVANETTDPGQAHYVEVTVTPTTMNAIFPVTFLGAASNQATMDAVAVAGLDVAVCQFTPLYICNPYENVPGTTIYDAIQNPAIRQREIILKWQGGGGTQNGPGNYGFLESHRGPGAPELWEDLASINPATCFVQNGVSVRTGSIASVRNALNVRFDLFEGSFNSQKGNASYRPARNVRKGYDPGGGTGCSQSDANTEPPNTDYRKLPRDNTYPHANGRIGDGNWACQAYWNVNFSGGTAPPAGCTASPPTVSRHDVYRHEIDNGLVSNPSNGTPAETGDPQCYTGGTLNDTPDRRILFGAIINCQQYAAELVGGSGNSIPVETFAKFFLVEPIDNENDLYVELTGLVDPATDPGIVHDLVQLYR